MTRLFEESNGSADSSAPSAPNRKTRLLRNGGTTLVEFSDQDGQDSFEPVVAWLVVVDGPGKGQAVQLSYGMSVIGSGPDNRVALDFGDSHISQNDHFSIAYDGENQEFHIVPGRGKNLVRLQGRPLLMPQLLEAYTEIRVGTTTLRFVPFCSKDWDWMTREAKSE